MRVARLRHAIDHVRERRSEQQIERRLREREHLIAAGGSDGGEEFHDGGHGGRGIGDFALEPHAGAQ